MFEVLRSLGTGPFWGVVAWQSTLLLVLGLAASAGWSRWPARSHRLLVLAMAAALVAPLLTVGVRSLGWGLIGRLPSFETPRAFARPQTTSESPPPAALTVPRASAPEAMSVSGSLPRNAPALSTVRASLWGHVNWPALAARSWAVLSLLVAARWLTSVVVALRVVHAARPLECETVTTAARFAATKLKLAVVPGLYESGRVRCPVIWCWGLRPRVLLPSRATWRDKALDWVGVLCHELAHWKRRDHLAALVAEITVCALPWNPLAWWAKARLGQLSEHACDDWVLAGGQPATDYAESLLGLTPQRRGSMALAAVTSRHGLVSRIEHILDDRRSSPIAGRFWSTLAGAAALACAATLALAQGGPPARQAGVSETKGKSVATARDRSFKAEGVILALDGAPAKGARVLWIGHPRMDQSLSFAALPKDHEDRARGEAHLTEGRTDERGRFVLEASFDPGQYFSTQLLVIAPNTGLLAHLYKESEGALTLALAAEVPIKGRLLSPAGMPVAGAKVTFLGVRNDRDDGGISLGSARQGATPPAYWPEAQVTDNEGRFTMNGLYRGGHASLELDHADYALDEVVVSSTMELTPSMKGFEIIPVEPTFTHTLEPARPVQGVITDRKSGKALANVLVEMIPMRRHGGMRFKTRTNEQGRYRISGHAADTFFTTVFPPTDSGYLPANDIHGGWPAGAKFLEKNFALDQGRVIRGRVVDAATKAPVAHASVVYQPKRANKSNNRGHDFRSPALCDADGRFAITGLAGEGIVVVDAPSRDALRRPVPHADEYGVGFRGTRGAWYPHGFATINVPDTGEPAAVEIAIEQGKTLRAQALAPDGTALDKVVAWCAELNASQINNHPQGQPFEKGLFELHGVEPNRTYRVYFMNPRRKLGKIVELALDPKNDAPVPIRLEPMARAHGTFVYAPGAPAPRAQGYANIVLTGGDVSKFGRDDILGGTFTEIYSNILGQEYLNEEHDQASNAQGEFHVDSLIPGVRFFVLGSSGNKESFTPVGPLEPGEDRDLGNIVLKERKP